MTSAIMASSKNLPKPETPIYRGVLGKKCIFERVETRIFFGFTFTTNRK